MVVLDISLYNESSMTFWHFDVFISPATWVFILLRYLFLMGSMRKLAVECLNGVAITLQVARVEIALD